MTDRPHPGAATGDQPPPPTAADTGSEQRPAEHPATGPVMARSALALTGDAPVTPGNMPRRAVRPTEEGLPEKLPEVSQDRVCDAVVAAGIIHIRTLVKTLFGVDKIESSGFNSMMNLLTQLVQEGNLKKVGFGY